MTPNRVADQLRAWAHGVHTSEAAVELLIRAHDGRYLDPDAPWIGHHPSGAMWLDADALAVATGGMSAGERAVVAIAASLLGDGHPVALGDAAARLDRDTLDLVLAALSHAGGAHEHVEYVIDLQPDGTELVTPWGPRLELGPLHPWPSGDEQRAMRSGMHDYDTVMKSGQSEYQDVLDLLGSAGLPAAFTQTGGMCAALEITLDDGRMLLVTDEQGPLSWDRDGHRGWAVGLYPPVDDDNGGEPLVLESTERGEAETLLPLVQAVLRAFTDREGDRPAPAGGGAT